MSKDAYYFSHDSNAHTDPKILKLRMSLGWEGYGIYWAIIESLRNQDNYMICESEFMFLTLSLAIDEAKLKQMLSKCLEVNLLEICDGNIFSPSLLRRMERADEIRNKRRKAGSIGGKAKANAKQMLKQSSSKLLALKERKLKEIKEKESKRNKAFEPPTLIQVKQYFIEKGYREDVAIKAFEFYDVADWKDSKGNQVKNWKQKMNGVWFKDENKIAKSNISDCFGA